VGDAMPPVLSGYVLVGDDWTPTERGRGTATREFAHRRPGGTEDVMVVAIDRARMLVVGHSERYPLTAHAAREALLSWFLVNRVDPMRQSEEMRRLGSDRGLWESVSVRLAERDVAGERIEYGGWWLVCVLTPAVIIGIASQCEESLEQIALRPKTAELRELRPDEVKPTRLSDEGDGGAV
jgi:hypothetical protein